MSTTDNTPSTPYCSGPELSPAIVLSRIRIMRSRMSSEADTGSTRSRMESLSERGFFRAIDFGSGPSLFLPSHTHLPT